MPFVTQEQADQLAKMTVRCALLADFHFRLRTMYLFNGAGKLRVGDCLNMPVPPLGGRVFASKAALARALAGKPKETADCVYGGPRGREGTPAWQGSLYIGRGPMQETHLNNYRAARDEIRRQPGGTACPDLVAHPELLASDPELGVRDVFAQWHLKDLSHYAQRQDWTTLSDVLNTGNPNDSVKPHGLPRRLRATAQALAIWPADTWGVGKDVTVASTLPEKPPRGLRQGDRGDEVKALQERLVVLGYGPGPADGIFGVLTNRAVVAFQAEHQLKPDGVVGGRTAEILAVTAKAPGEHNNLTVKDLAATSTTVHWTRRVKATVAAVFGINAGVEADQQLGLGLVDSAIGQAEQVKGLGERAIGLGLPAPAGHTIKFLVIAVACLALGYAMSKIEWGRLKAAIRGG